MNAETTLLGKYVGNPMYGIAQEHGFAVLLVGLLIGAAIVLRVIAALGGRRSLGLLTRYGSLDSVHRLLAWLLAISTVLTVGMGIGRLGTFVAIWLVGVGVAQGVVLLRLLSGRSWRRPLTIVMLTTLTVNLGLIVAGVTVDQVGFVTALIQVAALAVVLRSVESGRWVRRLATLTIIGAVGLTTLAGWTGAVVAGIDGEKLGQTPPPGVLLPVGISRSPTQAEVVAAAEFHARTIAAIAKYADLSVAAPTGISSTTLLGPNFTPRIHCTSLTASCSIRIAPRRWCTNRLQAGRSCLAQCTRWRRLGRVVPCSRGQSPCGTRTTTSVSDRFRSPLPASNPRSECAQSVRSPYQSPPR